MDVINEDHALRYRGKTQSSKKRVLEEEMTLCKAATSPSRRAKPYLSNSLKHIFGDVLNKSQSYNVDLFDDVEDNPTESTTSFQTNERERMRSLIKRAIEIEFPLKKNTPTAMDLIHVGDKCNEANEARYGPGDWVEVLGDNMKWRLDMITKVVRQAPDHWDWNSSGDEENEPQWRFHYHAGSDVNLREEDLRSPEEGLKIIFGNRPWVWQQWAMLKLEEKLRFQEGHKNDCVGMDVQKYGADLWDHWLEHPANADFRNVFYDERVGAYGRSQLLNHIQKPFHLIDRLAEDKDMWDFDGDENISVFTYMSLLGAGSFIPIVVFYIQFFIPSILVRHSSDVADRCAWQDDGGKYPLNRDLMILVVFVLYLITIVPELFVRFYDVEGDRGTVYSRLLSLRRELWDQGDDGIIQMIGFKLDLLMSTGYETALLLLNMYVLLQSETAIEVLLDALAFTFVAKIDEEIVKSSWWDPKNRWIIAGAIEVIIAKTVRFRNLASTKLFSEKYGIPEKSLIDSCNGDDNFLKNKVLAMSDAKEEKHLTQDEIVLNMFREIALESGNSNALLEYDKPKVYFGIIETIFGSMGRANPIFMDFKSYRTWSRWDKVLYMAQVPDLDNLFECDGDNVHVITNFSGKIEPDTVANFYPDEDRLTDWQNFLNHLIDVLIHDLPNGYKNSCRHAQSYKIVRLIIHAWSYMINVITYLIVLVFPLVLVALTFRTIYELCFQKCITWMSTVVQRIMQIPL